MLKVIFDTAVLGIPVLVFILVPVVFFASRKFYKNSGDTSWIKPGIWAAAALGGICLIALLSSIFS